MNPQAETNRAGAADASAGAGARRLNFGCGEDYREGWVNLDLVRLPRVDVVHNMNEFPYPFADNEFDHVFARHVLEHVPHHIPPHAKDGFILIMEEFHRILKPGGTLEVISPYYKADTAWVDPTHTRVLHPDVFSYFTASKYGFYTPVRYELLERDVPKWASRAPHFFPIGRQRLGIVQHLAIRAPWLGSLVRAPHEMRWVLRCLKNSR